jgi:hypothetical protein
MNTEFKTLDAPIGDYYYKHGDDYVDQYGEAIYPATSLPPQTEIVTRIVTREETITETEEYTEYEAYSEYRDYVEPASSNNTVLGLGLVFVIVLVVAAPAIGVPAPALVQPAGAAIPTR